MASSTTIQEQIFASALSEHSASDSIHEILSKFNAYAFALFDPIEHAEFESAFLNCNLKNYKTEKRKLFTISLSDKKPKINPKRLFNLFLNRGLHEDVHIISNIDCDIALYKILMELELEYSDLPLLLVSTSLTQHCISAIKSNASIINSQIKTLSKLSYTSNLKLDLKNINIKTRSESSNEIDGIFNIELKKSFGEILLDLVKAKRSNLKEEGLLPTEPEFYQNLQKKYIKEREDYSSLVTTSDQMMLVELATAYSQYNYRFRSHAKLANDIPNNETALPKLIPNKKLLFNQNQILTTPIEPESRIVLHTTTEIYNFFSERFKTEDFDFSPLVIGLAKIFEIEINLSLVHVFREFLKIEMPDYFNKYKPNHPNATIDLYQSSGNISGTVDFNMCRKHKWLPPGIGQSEMVANYLFAQNFIIEDFTREEMELILSNWSLLRQVRNMAAHNSITTFEDFNKVNNAINSLIVSGTFEKIVRLKIKLRNIRPTTSILLKQI